MMSHHLISYILMAAMRDKFIVFMLVAMVLSACMSLFLGSSAIIEQDQFSVVFTAGSVRLVGILGIVLFTVFFVRRSYDTKDIEFLLSRPISKQQLVFSYAFAFSGLALLLAFLSALVLYANGFGRLPLNGFILWAVSLAVEYVVIVNVAFFFSMVISSAVGAAMATLGFYVLGRLSGQFLGIIDSHKVEQSGVFDIMQFTVQVTTLITPRLDLMAQSSWLVYDASVEVDVFLMMLKGVVFSFVILLATLIDLRHRQF